MRSFLNSRKPLTKKPLAKKQWKAVLSKPSAILATSKTKVRFDLVLKLLKKHHPDAHCALNFTNPFELLIATMLSAQCTDVRVNLVTPELFKNYPDPKRLSRASVEAIEALIKSTGFFRNKAKNIKACCELLDKKHKGIVPKTLDELYELPGVGRKTGNVVLGNAYNIASGVVVDTHVMRLANRLGWVKSADPVKIETLLNKLCPKSDWIMLSHYLIAHGRSICVARSPKCQACFLKDACPKVGV